MTLPVLVVLDTNVLVAAGFNPGSGSAFIVRAVESGLIRLVWNEAIRKEYRVTIGRIPPLDWSPVQELLTEESKSQAGEPSEEDLKLIADPQDRKFAALARASGAILVTADHHLLSVRDQLDVIIRTPSELVKSLNWPDEVPL